MEGDTKSSSLLGEPDKVGTQDFYSHSCLAMSGSPAHTAAWASTRHGRLEARHFMSKILSMRRSMQTVSLWHVKANTTYQDKIKFSATVNYQKVCFLKCEISMEHFECIHHSHVKLHHYSVLLEDPASSQALATLRDACYHRAEGWLHWHTYLLVYDDTCNSIIVTIGTRAAHGSDILLSGQESKLLFHR